MQLLRAADVPITERDRLFRWSRARAIGFVVVLAGLAATLAWLGLLRDSPVSYYLLGVLVVGSLLMRRLVLARFRPSNWLLRAGDGGLYVQLRSLLNHHLPADDPTVVFLAFGEIRSARLVRHRRIVATRDLESQRGGKTEIRRREVELELAGDTEPLARALDDEAARRAPRERRWYGWSAIKYRHEPARLESPTTLRLEWSAVPGAGALFELLEPHARIAPPLDETRDFTTLAGAEREQQERRLAELARAGQVIDAIALARALRGYDLTQARAYVDRLANESQRRAA